MGISAKSPNIIHNGAMPGLMWASNNKGRDSRHIIIGAEVVSDIIAETIIHSIYEGYVTTKARLEGKASSAEMDVSCKAELGCNNEIFKPKGGKAGVNTCKRRPESCHIARLILNENKVLDSADLQLRSRTFNDICQVARHRAFL